MPSFPYGDGPQKGDNSTPMAAPDSMNPAQPRPPVYQTINFEPPPQERACRVSWGEGSNPNPPYPRGNSQAGPQMTAGPNPTIGVAMLPPMGLPGSLEAPQAGPPPYQMPQGMPGYPNQGPPGYSTSYQYTVFGGPTGTSAPVGIAVPMEPLFYPSNIRRGRCTTASGGRFYVNPSGFIEHMTPEQYENHRLVQCASATIVIIILIIFVCILLKIVNRYHH
uniref:CX domain-containing protein n=1 Tax=Panagrellus redivivus TaxID=6233 RepID=A0A7E4VXC5_PANRE